MRKFAKHCLIIGVLTAVIVSFFFTIGFLSTGQKQLQDRLYGQKALDDIVILAIDDTSISQIGRWPWDRKEYANILPKLKSAKVVGIDIVFSEPSNPKSDEELVNAVKEAGNVVLAYEITKFQAGKKSVRATEALAPLPELSEASQGVGIINLITDKDGVVRSVNNNIESELDLFAQTVASKATNAQLPQDNRVLINMAGTKNSYQTIPLADLYFDRIDPSFFEDKIVLIGATAPDLHDDHLTPAAEGKKVPGVEVHANIVQQIITRRSLEVIDSWVIILSVFIASIAIALLMTKLNAWAVAGITLLAFVSHYLIAIRLFNHGILGDMIYVPLAMVLSYAGNLVHLYLGEQREKREVLKAWSKYVAPSVVHDLRAHPEKLSLGGEKRLVTIFFSDVRGFTSLSEKLTPEQLVQVLNEYLTEMTDIIMEDQGIVDKYIGDAIMAIWGAPLDQPDQAEIAVRSTIKMNKKLEELNVGFRERGWPELAIGSGLNTGHAVIGNMGSTQRFDYTAMGDTVNLASRLEGLTKPYGVLIIVSQTTRKKLPASFVVRELDLVAVKGKKEPITIYEVMGEKPDVTEKQLAIKKHFEKGLELYRKTKFKEAIKEFKESAKLGDKTSKTFIERSEYFTKNHPGKKWDGVWVMKSK